MTDWLHMIALMVAGGVIGLITLAHLGVLAMSVVVYAAGWATAQYDHNLKPGR